ncbi:hypothetical protein JXO52_04715 [bacterium]|nr:hypothetical protein [bacterium]
MKKNIWIGIDIGSVSVQLAVFIDDTTILETTASCLQDANPGPWRARDSWICSPYLRHGGSPLETARELLTRFTSCIDSEKLGGICATGTGGRKAADLFGCAYANEIRSAAEGVASFHPDVRTIISLGGERSAYIHLETRGHASPLIISYGQNGECAAGTGTFFDQQAGRLEYPIEEVSEAIASVTRSAAIAGRCSVFAKSDMIHAQQRGYTPPEVLKGLCTAVVRNFKGTVTKGKEIHPKVALIGGMAMNRGIVDEIRRAFSLAEADFVLSPWHAWFSAAGAAVIARRGNENGKGEPAAFPAGRPAADPLPVTEPLSMANVRLLRDTAAGAPPGTAVPGEVFLGLDIGSVSTNLALIDSEGRVMHGIYLMTRGRPVETVEAGLKQMADMIPDSLKVRAVGTTGSGRELIAALVGADTVKDEITAHKTGAAHIAGTFLERDVDTIFEIGGQDSKFIAIENGIVTDFALNEACAAGTGSFLEEQAGELGISIKEEFSSLALASKSPLRLGERCTVFMEKEMLPYLHRGVSREDICAGLAVSVVKNYLNRVVKKRRIGDTIFFQGGTAFNDSVAAAFATVLGKEIIVPPHNGIMGAIGAALLARDKIGARHTAFRGWDLSSVERNTREFTCKGCSNHCLIQEFTVDGEKSYWGDKCSDRYRKAARSANLPSGPDLFAHRNALMFSDRPAGRKSTRGRVGIPRVLAFYDRLPFWRTYFEALSFEVVLSGESRQHHVERGVEAAVADQCFPVQIAHGHVAEIAGMDTDIVFIPNVVNEIDPANSIASFICPWTQTLPLVIAHTPGFGSLKHRLLDPNVQFREGREFVTAHLYRDWARSRGIGEREHMQAAAAAWSAQEAFVAEVRQAGAAALRTITESGKPMILLLGRPYNLYDTALNLNIPEKLRSLYGLDVLPLDYLDLDRVDISHIHDHMFWNYGRRIIQAAALSRRYSAMHIIYLSNFKCGPDSYIRHYIQDASGQPFLFLQLDSHANDAGVMTRIEAYLESKRILS